MTNYLRLAACSMVLFGLAGCDTKTTLDIRRLDDAREASIGVITGSTGEAGAKERFPDADIKSFDDPMDAVSALLAGQLDAMVTGRPVATLVARNNPTLAVVEEPLQFETTAIAVRKDATQLLDRLNSLIRELRADGTLKAMDARWFKTTPGPYEEPVIDPPGEGEPLVIGVAATREPFSFVDGQGRVTGHDGELARRIAVALNRPVEFSNMRFAALIPALQSGKIDMIVTGMTATEERAKAVSFTESYYDNAQVMLVRRAEAGPGETPAGAVADQGKIRSNDDLAGSRVAAMLGSVQDVYVRNNYPTAEVLQYNTASDLVVAVESARVDMGVADKDFLGEILADNDQLAMLDEPLFSMDVGAGFNKNNPELRDAFDAFLASIRADGTYDDMVNRWFRRKEKAMPSLPEEGTGDVIDVGTAAFGFPYGAIQDGDFAGFDIELARRFAASQGKQARFVHLEFGALVAAQAAGKVDMLATGMFITPERQERIDFSKPYYSTEIRIFGLKKNLAQGSAPSAASAPSTNVLSSTADLHGRRIGVMLGSAQEGFATKTYPDSEVLQYRTAADMVLAVHDGKVDAGFMDADPLREILSQQPGFAILGEPLFVSPAGAGFSKGSVELRDRFNQFLAGIRADGTYDDMIARWIQGKDSTMPTLPDIPRQGKLVVATNDFGLPFVAVQDGRLVGFDMELAERFAHYLGREIELLNMDWSAVIAATVSGKADVGLGCMFITEERKQNILFSDPYYEAQSLAIALASRLPTAAAAGNPEPVPPAQPTWLDGLKASVESNLLRENRYLLIWDGLKTTVIISVLATLFGTLLGALVCGMRMSPSRWLEWPARTYIAVLRGTPVLVLLMLIFYVVFASVDISPVFVAVVAFGMNFAAYVAEIYRSGIQGIDRGQWEAGIAMGFSKVKTFLYVILPQTVQRILPVYKGEFISLVKMTSIVGYIAVQDLTKASDIIRSRTFDAFFPLVMVAILYFVIAWVLIQALEYLERRTDPKRRRRKAVSA